jgi:hypothetical protein
MKITYQQRRLDHSYVLGALCPAVLRCQQAHDQLGGSGDIGPRTTVQVDPLLSRSGDTDKKEEDGKKETIRRETHQSMRDHLRGWIGHDPPPSSDIL